jgi:hypothetical protein
MVLAGGPQQIPIDDFYLFQQDMIYRHYEIGNKPVNATLSSPAPGILVNAVIGDLGAFGMHAPPNSELLLLP